MNDFFSGLALVFLLLVAPLAGEYFISTYPHGSALVLGGVLALACLWALCSACADLFG